jgi:hypothetical protein
LCGPTALQSAIPFYQVSRKVPFFHACNSSQLSAQPSALPLMRPSTGPSAHPSAIPSPRQSSQPSRPLKKSTGKPTKRKSTRKPVRRCATAGSRCPTECCSGLRCFGSASNARTCKPCAKVTDNCRKTKDCCILAPGAVSICLNGSCCKEKGSSCGTGARCCSRKCNYGLCVWNLSVAFSVSCL